MMALLTLQDLSIEVVKSGLSFKSSTNHSLLIDSKHYGNLLKIIKTIYTTDINERIGRVIQISKTHVCFFKLDALHFTCRNSAASIPIRYISMDKVCAFIKENGLKSEKFDEYEKVILQNFIGILGCVSQSKRKVILSSIREREDKVFNEVISTVLESSDLPKKHEFYESIVRKLVGDNIPLLELLSYCFKVIQKT